MRKNLLITLFVVFFANPAFSMPDLTDEFQIHRTSHGSILAGGLYAGEFDLELLYPTSSTPVNYVSFCLEKEEDFAFDRTYDVQTIEEFATGGGMDVDIPLNDGRDYLSEKTKWVYMEYTFGNHFDLAKDVDLRYETGFAESDTQMLTGTTGYESRLGMYIQEIMWFLEDEPHTLSIGAQWIYDTYVDVADHQYDTNGYNIKVVNYLHYDVDGDGNPYGYRPGQSQIIGEPVPEPATVLLFGTGLVGLLGFARKRSKK